MDILSVAEMREVERIADAHGLSYAQMMQNAGRAAADVIHVRLDALGLSQAHVLVLAGPGNNGGDGLVCAAALAGAGHTVQCYLLKPRADDDPLLAALRELGIFIAHAQSDLRLRVLHQLVTHAHVIVDALLGTGVSRLVEGKLLDVLREVAAGRHNDTATRGQGDLHVSLDGPTGMNYDTGALDPAAVPADLTITFHAPKRGHYCFPAAEACGELVVVPIGIEQLANGNWQSELDSQLPIANVVLANDAFIRGLLPSRSLDGNKGSFGKAVIAGGCVDYVGAPSLSANAAYRVGAGLVALAVPHEVKQAAASTCREAIFVRRTPSGNAGDTHLSPESAHALIDFVAHAPDDCALAIGPGLGQAESTTQFIAVITGDRGVRSLSQKGLVCDADALNLLAMLPDWHTLLPSLTVLTPHPGEMSRLTKLSIAEVQADRIGNALRFAREWGHVVLLKGAHTVIAAPDGRAVVLPFSNPAMATAGSGDVLTGCIAGLMAQGRAPFEAAVCGGYLHGAAGERWRAQHGDAGMLAGDLLPLLPDAMRAIKSQSDR